MGNRIPTIQRIAWILILCTSVSCNGSDIQNRVLTETTQQEQQEKKEERKEPTIRDKVHHTFIGEIGVSEQGGDNQGERITQYLNSTGLGAGYAWCAAFLSWGFTQHDIDNPQSAWSPDWFPGDKVIYRRGSDKAHQDWKATDVIGLWFQSKGRIAHVGTIDTTFDNTVISIEGNTSDYSEREGDRVMRKRRYRRQIHSVSRFIPASDSIKNVKANS